MTAPQADTAPQVNPLTALTCGFSAWLLVLGINRPAVSIAVVAASWLVGVWATRRAAVVLNSLALGLPAGASMLIVHAPFGQHMIAPLISSDGLVIAGELALRFLALMASILAAMCFSPIPQLIKAIQGSRLNPTIGYIIGASLQFLPQARRAVRTVREARILTGELVRGRVLTRLAIPVMVHTLSLGADRATAVEVAGVGRPGRRTVLRPVYDSGLQKLVRIAVPVACAVAVIAWKVVAK